MLGQLLKMLFMNDDFTNAVRTDGALIELCDVVCEDCVLKDEFSSKSVYESKHTFVALSTQRYSVYTKQNKTEKS